MMPPIISQNFKLKLNLYTGKKNATKVNWTG